MSESPDLPVGSNPVSPTADEEGLHEEEEEDEEDTLSPPLSSLREISPLASWTVSTYKPGCGVAALLSPSTSQFWQSDGPQPHLLNIHFFKLVTIARLRVYLDLELDESYTPTRMLFLAGHSEYDVVEFAEWRAPNVANGPRGWVDINLESCCSRDADDDSDDGVREPVLRCMFLQVRVLENHQNGKDTHIRGVQVWARDEREGRVTRPRPMDYVADAELDEKQDLAAALDTSSYWADADFGELEIR